MGYEQILYEIEDRVLTITLNRPERLNAYTTQMGNELIDAFTRANIDDQVRVIIVTGAGRAFCAGADLEKGGQTFDYRARGLGESLKDKRDRGGLITLKIYESRKPVIAALNGPAVGIGITMTLPMDIRLASQTARIGFVFVQRGITPEACSTWFLPRLVGISRAAEWVLSGRVFPPEEALEYGLVSRVLPPEALMGEARALAQEIAKNTSAVSVALARQMLWKMLGASHPMEAHKIESKAIIFMGAGADAQEGVKSFLEKRSPNFQMSASHDLPDFFPWWEDPQFP
jgi:enoyl-CoA hydratase/carnithine racemase